MTVYVISLECMFIIDGIFVAGGAFEWGKTGTNSAAGASWEIDRMGAGDWSSV